MNSLFHQIPIRTKFLNIIFSIGIIILYFVFENKYYNYFYRASFYAPCQVDLIIPPTNQLGWPATKSLDLGSNGSKIRYNK